MRTYFSFLFLFFFLFNLSAQSDNSKSEIEQITSTLMDYIDGTANGEPARVKRAFHKDLNLYHVGNDSLVTWSGQGYTDRIKEGRKSNRIGKIVSIDFENNAAMAKVEIDMPNAKRIYTDYFLLLKIENHWQIIHKSFTYVDYPGKE